MKVAILGAGISGLSCAKILEDNGITPTIFEKRRNVGDRFISGEVFLDTLNRPIKDSFSYLANEHKIFLQPVGNISELLIKSQNEKTTINGTLGFSNSRGRIEDALEKQLLRQIKTKIIYNSKIDYEELKKDFTHIVIATGDGSYSEKQDNYITDFTVKLKGGVVKGKFSRNKVIAWLNNNYSPKGYSYMIPLSENLANIVIAYPDNNDEYDSDLLWDAFYKDAKKELNQELPIEDLWSVSKYQIGKCKRPRIGNTFYVGNCYGSIMPFLGFGQFASILSGVYSAYDICGIDDYEKSLKNLESSYKNSIILRKGMEKLDNDKFDMIVKRLDGIAGKLIFNKNTNFLNLISKAISPIIK